MLALLAILMIAAPSAAEERPVQIEAPGGGPCFDPAEFVARVPRPWVANPFTDAELTGVFKAEGRSEQTVRGFVDAPDGSVMRLRFCPARVGLYRWQIVFRAGEVTRTWEGTLRCDPSERAGPVIVDPDHPRHFKYAGSGRPFYHLGYTAYHLLDPTNDDAQIQALIDYCAREGFNKIRFLLTGYPRDSETGTTTGDVEYGVADPWSAPNYGARPGQVNALPAWPGKPHAYDFTRFNVEYWQKADRAARRMREAGIVATCIFTIEKQRLPKEYGALTKAEYLLYQYAIARLAAFDNVWWDLGNEHNEFRDVKWGQTMGRFVKEQDPYDRLLSAHAYADFLYPRAPWADFIITQQYGDEQAVYDWVMKYRDVPRPYVNEEYGYEGRGVRNQKGVPGGPGHGQDASRVRRSHWSIAMAGGYATYGDWDNGIAWYYMGEPGTGVGGTQLKHLRAFFEALPFSELEPAGPLVTEGFCLARRPDVYVLYLPRGGQSRIDLTGARPPLAARWFDPSTGRWQPGPALRAEPCTVESPSPQDWALLIRGGQADSRAAP